jgi:hypothetical protein
MTLYQLAAYYPLLSMYVHMSETNSYSPGQFPLNRVLSYLLIRLYKALEVIVPLST